MATVHDDTAIPEKFPECPLWKARVLVSSDQLLKVHPRPPPNLIITPCLDFSYRCNSYKSILRPKNQKYIHTQRRHRSLSKTQAWFLVPSSPHVKQSVLHFSSCSMQTQENLFCSMNKSTGREKGSGVRPFALGGSSSSSSTLVLFFLVFLPSRSRFIFSFAFFQS